MEVCEVAETYGYTYHRRLGYNQAMEAIRRQVQADENGVIRLTGLPLKAGESVDVLITSPSSDAQRKTAAAEMRAIMDRAGKLAMERGLTEAELGRILSEG